MKLARFLWQGQTYTGIIQGEMVHETRGEVFANPTPGTAIAALSTVQLLPPCLPTKIICIGKNYKDHAAEMQAELPEEPIIFLKPLTSLLPPDGTILYPQMSQRVDYEGELAVVIKDTCRHVSEADAASHILGYTIANDVTARDLQKRDGQWTRAKGFDTFCPLGPWIVTDLDAGNLQLRTRLNGEVKQQASTALLIFGVNHLISFVSQVMTLQAGDVILTGTPAGIGPMQPGDTIEVEIEGIGLLQNTIGRQHG